MKNIYRCVFFCVIEGDLLIFAAISHLIRQFNPAIKCSLIVPSHNRLPDHVVEKYDRFFDEVIKVENAVASKNIVSGVISILNYIRAIEKVPLKDKTLVFMFDLYKISEMVFFNHLMKLKKVVNNLDICIVTPYLSNPFDSKRAQLLIRETIISSFYSLLFAGWKLTLRYKIRGTKLEGFLKFKSKVDYQLVLGKSKYRTLPSEVIHLNNYPVPVLKDFLLIDKDVSNSGSVMVLVSTLHGKLDHNYWKHIVQLMDAISKKFANFTILVKDHPGTKSEVENHLTLNENIVQVDSKVSAEAYYLSSGLKIKYVFGYGSTAILTASWFGIKCIDYTELLNFDEFMKDYYSDFLILGNDIYSLKSINEVFYLKVSGEERNDEEQYTQIMTEWSTTFRTLGLPSDK